MDKTTIRKNKEVEEMNNIIDQLDLTHIYRTLYLKTAEYKFFSTTYGTFFRTEHDRPQKS